MVNFNASVQIICPPQAPFKTFSRYTSNHFNTLEYHFIIENPLKLKIFWNEIPVVGKWTCKSLKINTKKSRKVSRVKHA
jgi:hypothetical protein